MDRDPFEGEYVKDPGPSEQYRRYAWRTAIGLQAVDGLETSEYLAQIAERNIAGEITLEEVDELLQSYYREHPPRAASDRTEEADRVSSRITALLSERAFSFTPGEYVSIHRRLFDGIFSHAGCIRDFNITKREWVLDGASVLYASAGGLRETLEYDFFEERKFSYEGLSIGEIIGHLADFVSRLWQIHPFAEGNTRATTVFFVKYLRALGFDVTNETFAENAWYFRNALVRANYTDLRNGIHETTEFLEVFLRNLLLGEKNPLHNRALHVSGVFAGYEKPDIDGEKPDIGAFETRVRAAFRPKTAGRVLELAEVLSSQATFGRSDVMRVIGVKSSRASELLRDMLDCGLIEPVSGHGKGRYRFRR